MKYDYIVIGAGVSGIAAAIILAKNGMDVALVEKSAKTAPLIIPDSYPIPRCRDEALGEGQSVDDYVIDPDYPFETYL